MNSEDLYQHLKDALNHFGLRWNQKEEMKVTFSQGVVVFSHGIMSIVIREDDNG